MSVPLTNFSNSPGEERFLGEQLGEAQREMFFKWPESLGTEAIDGQVYCAWRVYPV